jgi:hypothetical protein
MAVRQVEVVTVRLRARPLEGVGTVRLRLQVDTVLRQGPWLHNRLRPRFPARRPV